MFCWVPSHVGIHGNEGVDVLAKLALIEAYTNIKIPYTDLVYYAKSHRLSRMAIFLGSTSSEQTSFSTS